MMINKLNPIMLLVAHQCIPSFFPSFLHSFIHLDLLKWCECEAVLYWNLAHQSIPSFFPSSLLCFTHSFISTYWNDVNVRRCALFFDHCDNAHPKYHDALQWFLWEYWQQGEMHSFIGKKKRGTRTGIQTNMGREERDTGTYRKM